MLNLLIAQMSDTFSNVQGDAQRSLAINKARTIINIERTGLSFLVITLIHDTMFVLCYEYFSIEVCSGFLQSERKMDESSKFVPKFFF